MKGCARSTYFLLSATLMLIFVGWGVATAEEQKGTCEKTEKACCAKDKKDSACTKSSVDTAEDGISEDEWFMFYGVSNLYPRLKESEDKIDRLLNRGLGSLFPRWSEPDTFADWRDSVMLWDGFVGIGRDLGPEYCWTGTLGYSTGRILNSKRYYPLGLPLNIHADFIREVYFLSFGFDWYPWGKPQVRPEDEDKNMLVRMFRGSRPFFEIATGYVHLAREGNTRLNIPNLVRVAQVVDSQKDNLFYVSPRIAWELPIDDNDSLNMMASLLFFTSHTREYNSVSFYFFHRHRF